MWYHRSTSFRVSRCAALASIVVSITLGFSPIVAVIEPAAAVEPASVSTAASYPRVMAWWPDVHSLSAAEIARFDSVILYDWAGPQAQAIKAADPSTQVFLSSSASELPMYAEVNPESWKNSKIVPVSARWCVTQPGSTLTSAITATATTIGVATADTTRFRVGDILTIDEEFLEVQAVNAGTPGSLVVRRNAVVAGTRHVAAAHASGARVAAVVREFPNTALMDLTDQCPLVDVGNGPETFNAYLARVSAAAIADPVWDGIYFDMIESSKSWVLDAGFARAFDLNRSNVVPANADAFNAAWAAGVRTLESRVRGLVGDRPVLTNGASANWDLVNGGCTESLPAKATTPAEWRSRVFGTQQPYTGATYFAALSGLSPNYSSILTYDQESEPAVPLNSATWRPDYRRMRLGLTTALLGDGQFSYTMGTANLGDVDQLQWFDEYDNAGAGQGYLGAPLGAAQQVGAPADSADLLVGDGAFSTATQLNAWTVNSAEAGYSATKTLEGGAARVDIGSTLGEVWKLRLSHPVQVTAGTTYTLTFTVKSDRPQKALVFAAISDSPYTIPLDYSWVQMDTEWKTYTLTATSTHTLASTLRFNLGTCSGTVWLDDVKLQAGARNDVWRRDFENGISLVNASAAPVTVDLGGTFRKINGTQDRTVNDGSPVTSVTLPAMDGIVLLREAAPAPQPVPNVAPTAAITATPGTGTAPVAVSFSGAGSADSDGTIASYKWEFGDGTTQTGPAATHTYTAAGTYTAKLTVTDDDGATASATTQIVVNAPVSTGSKSDVHRFYNKKNGTHFLTASVEERDVVISSLSSVYTYEGVAYSEDPARNTQPLYRFYNRVNGTHFYTASKDEADNIVANLSHIYTLDGQAYNVCPTPVVNSIPVFRFYNVKNGAHFYTASTQERDDIIARCSSTFLYEGPAFWLAQ